MPFYERGVKFIASDWFFSSWRLPSLLSWSSQKITGLVYYSSTHSSVLLGATWKLFGAMDQWHLPLSWFVSRHCFLPEALLFIGRGCSVLSLESAGPSCSCYPIWCFFSTLGGLRITLLMCLALRRAKWLAGPGFIAVIGSGLMGSVRLVLAWPIRVVSTGAISIPLMQRVSFTLWVAGVKRPHRRAASWCHQWCKCRCFIMASYTQRSLYVDIIAVSLSLPARLSTSYRWRFSCVLKRSVAACTKSLFGLWASIKSNFVRLA